MADTLTTLSLITLAQEFAGDVVRQVNRRCVALGLLRVVPGEGKNIAWVPEFSGAIAETYSEGADAVNFGGDTQEPAILTWSLYRTNFHVSQLSMDSSATSSSPDGNRRLWSRMLVDNTTKLASTMNGDLYAGAGGNAMTGLATAIANSGTYATLDRGTFTDFQATVIDPGVSTVVTMALLRDDTRQIYEACGMQPDIALCSPRVFNVVGGLFDNTRRTIVSASQPGGIKLEVGWQAVELDGCVFYRDKDCTADTIYYLNSDFVEIQYLPSPEQDRLIAAAGGPVQATDMFKPLPVQFQYEMLAKTGAADKAMVRWTGNLVVTRPNTCGKRVNIA